MKKDDNKRNRPVDDRSNNDPHLRDHSGQQPGMNTISSSDSDPENHRLSETAKDGFHEGRPDPRADRNLDEAGEQEERIY
jgi:hypothetical protein